MLKFPIYVFELQVPTTDETQVLIKCAIKSVIKLHLQQIYRLHPDEPLNSRHFSVLQKHNSTFSRLIYQFHAVIEKYN